MSPFDDDKETRRYRPVIVLKLKPFGETLMVSR